MNLFITGIGTGIGTGLGKTVVSAVLTQFFKGDYWKPVQSGDLHQSDSLQIKKLVDENLQIHTEQYRLQHAVSPHQAAKEENIHIRLSDFKLPSTTKFIIVEGAGGLFVPLNNEDFIIDLITQLNLPVVLVAKDYLGCINHTMLSINALLQRKIRLEYFVFNGGFNPDTKAVLQRHIPFKTKIIELPEINLTKNEIKKITTQLIIK